MQPTLCTVVSVKRAFPFCRKLSITVSSGDRSYVPKVIDVEGGSVPSLVHRIATITVPGSTHGTVVLLKKQDLYYRHIYIRIKECQFVRLPDVGK